ncbi:hypothetical protein MUP32_02740 [Candidatus Microgenomates bacterium]|nr:hypothetical protein [Candidatus Microgenomates bacterium]
MFKKYDVKIKEILSSKPSETDWKSVLEDHREKIDQIQHERLIHLLVTIFVGLVLSISCFTTIVTQNLILLVFDLPLLLLFLGYLFHYRNLENTTQSWYLLEEEIKSSL